MNLIYDGYNVVQLQQALGDRGYTVDPWYIRRTSKNSKAYFFDKYTKKWRLIHLGDQFFFDDAGIPRKTGS